MKNIHEYKKKEHQKMMLTPLIEESKITLLHGESGSGKTMFAIKHLNKNNIIPLLIDFDDNEDDELKELGLKAENIDGEMFADDLMNKHSDKKILKDLVLIIDTWTLFCRYIGKEEIDAISILHKLSEEHSATIIILSHTVAFSGKEDKPDMDNNVYRHIKSRLYIRRTTLKSSIEYDLIIEKLRGYNGTKLLNIRTEKRE